MFCISLFLMFKNRGRRQDVRSGQKKFKLKASLPQTAFHAATTCHSAEFNKDSHFLWEGKLTLVSPNV